MQQSFTSQYAVSDVRICCKRPTFHGLTMWGQFSTQNLFWLLQWL